MTFNRQAYRSSLRIVALQVRFVIRFRSEMLNGMLVEINDLSPLLHIYAISREVGKRETEHYRIGRDRQ